MRFARLLAPAFAALVGLATSFAFAEDAPKKLFWKVTADNGSEVWLFGSIHVGTEDMYPLSKEIEDAFSKADSLVVEADIEGGDPAALQGLVMSKGMYEQGDSLKKHVSKENWAKLKAYCDKEGVPLDQLKPMKPWLVAVQLQGLMMQKLGVEATYGIDRHFIIKAKKKAKKPVLELESAELQINVISGFSDELQQEFLMGMVNEGEKGKESLDKMMDAWKKGDEAKMYEISTASVKENPKYKPVMEKLNDERNVGMLKKIEGWLGEEKKNSKFVVVGSLHLCGDKGLVKLLEATKKYKVERPALTAPVKEEKTEKSEEKPAEKK
ncbi:MAG: TraB/GumN family protein [Planctomycetota bacterium]